MPTATINTLIEQMPSRAIIRVLPICVKVRTATSLTTVRQKPVTTRHIQSTRLAHKVIRLQQIQNRKNEQATIFRSSTVMKTMEN